MMRLGIVGTGRMAERMLVCLAHLPQVRVSAVASAVPGRAEALAGRIGAGAARSAAALAGRADVDAVYVATGNAGHAAAALAAIAAGKPVLVEKPLAITPDQVAGVIAAAQAARVLLVENLWTLALPATRELIANGTGVGAETRDGTDGRPRLLQVDFGYPVGRVAQPGLFAADAGVVRDRGVYGLALALRLFGPADDLTCAVRTEAGCDVAAMIALRHRSGDLSGITVAFDALLPNLVTLSGPQGMISLSPSIGAESYRMQAAAAGGGASSGGPGRLARLKTLPALRALNRWRTASGGRTISYGADPYLPMLQHFSALVREGAGESPLVPLALSAAVHDLIGRARSAGGLA